MIDQIYMLGTISETWLAGVIIAVALLILKVVDWMISKAEKKELSTLREAITSSINSVGSTLSEDLGEVKGLIHKNIEISQKTWELHNKYDEDGVPLVYVPRSWVNLQSEIAKTCDSISRSQESITRTQEACLKVLEKMNDRMVDGKMINKDSSKKD